MSVRDAERAARWAGARTKRPRQARRVDPALADRVVAAIEESTGLRARVAGGRVEIPFADEEALAEIAEAFECVRP